MKKYKPTAPWTDEFECLRTLLDYNREDERVHWESVGRPDSGHIYLHIKRLDGFVDRAMEEKLPVSGSRKKGKKNEPISD